jgi:hypothetical protein
MVSAYVPTGVVLAAVTVNWDDPGAATELDEKLAVASVGSLLTERPMLPA